VGEKTRPRLPAAALVVTAALALAACGGGGGKKATPQPAKTPQSTSAATSTPAGGGGGATLSLSADKTQLKFNKSVLSAPSGKVTIAMKNPSALQHDVAITGHGVNTVGKVVGQGGTSTVTAKLKPGKYTFFCSVDGHRQAGMEGTLTVK
jgi:plastocyanin